jgi:spoIIIJ-associated protein
MGKGKDFYGKDIAEVIEQACKELAASREDLDIEVIETGSAGIFGLCKKKAHIRVQRKVDAPEEATVEVVPVLEKSQVPAKSEEKPPVVNRDKEPEVQTADVCADEPAKVLEEHGGHEHKKLDEPHSNNQSHDESAGLDAPSEESLEAIRTELHHLLTLMGFPSDVGVHFDDNTVHCHITGSFEEQIVGPEGRTLDSLQYLLRKMVSSHLPDRVMLSLNAGDFRERRSTELKVRAGELADMVKADGKTQSIPALNPSERRVVHMVLQEDKGVRSRSVGEGLFKKVLIYKPGKGRRPASKKRRGGQGGRSSGD